MKRSLLTLVALVALFFIHYFLQQVRPSLISGVYLIASFYGLSFLFLRVGKLLKGGGDWKEAKNVLLWFWVIPNLCVLFPFFIATTFFDAPTILMQAPFFWKFPLGIFFVLLLSGLFTLLIIGIKKLHSFSFWRALVTFVTVAAVNNFVYLVVHHFTQWPAYTSLLGNFIPYK